MKFWDAVIVGGGAAGFFGAITCAQHSAPGTKVLILEKSKKLLSKVKISGGGRCNVTHSCYEPKRMATHYPRGHKALIGPLHRFGVAETIEWFSQHGVTLKTEDDGRMFPVTDDSQTIIDCLRTAARESGVEVRTSASVKAIRVLHEYTPPHFELILDNGERVYSKQILLATGGTRASGSASLARMLGHTLKPAVPSLFTFHIDDPRIKGLQGLSVSDVEVRVDRYKLVHHGPLLITHRGMSGPAILKLSAWGARELSDAEYEFELLVNWLPGVNVSTSLDELRKSAGARQIASRSPFDALPKRLWQGLVTAAYIAENCKWSELSKGARTALIDQLTRSRFQVRGKSTNKDEFVTCGGVVTDEVDMRTMQSRIHQGLFFAGELFDIDGITGGFNFQNAWTTGYLAGTAMATASVAT